MATKRVVSRQSPVPALVALVYLVFLILPWVLARKVANDPESLIRTHSGGSYHFRFDDSIVAAIPVLEAVQVILCFPVLSTLLARAAVVFSQRRKPDQTCMDGTRAFSFRKKYVSISACQVPTRIAFGQRLTAQIPPPLGSRTSSSRTCILGPRNRPMQTVASATRGAQAVRRLITSGAMNSARTQRFGLAARSTQSSATSYWATTPPMGFQVPS